MGKRRALTACFAVALALRCHREAPPPAAKQSPQVTSSAAVPKSIEAKTSNVPSSPPIARDLDAIAAAKTLNVLFTFNSTGYFIYRGQTMGYEYDLLNLYAREMNLRLEPVVVRDSRVLFDKLNRGEGDVVAAALAATTNQTEVAMTDSLYETKPVVVQRAQPIQVQARLVTTPAQLAGQQVHIPRTSPYLGQLLELNNALDNDINVVEVDETSDKLIQRLAEGQIGFTVTADNLAALKVGEYSNLVIQPAIGPPQPIVWALRSNAPALLQSLNAWIEKKRKAGLLGGLYRKYFLDRRGFRQRATSQFLTAETGRISPYDDWFREYAKIPGWDWRLVAAQAFQESKFNPNARSWAGAIGLLQLMPMTARQLRANPGDPRQNIEAACHYLWQIDDQWKSAIDDENERFKFILASYNCGVGHVQDAVRLAEKHGDNPKRWDDVAYWLVQKSNRAVYNDPVVKHGFVRGTEPVGYVSAILAQFANYRQFVPKTPAETAPPAAAAAAR